tara:strand:+ start:469 stop:1308 length:840 start_codon:yes stop_codon:yes gene_type:complete
MNRYRLDTDLISLRAFIAVVEEGSFSAAAVRVGRTQSAVSLQIAKLEERLGVKLLTRTSRTLELTRQGEQFISYARRILELADEAVLAVSSPEEKVVLRIGFSEYLVPQHLHKLLATFRRANPNCDLSLMLGVGDNLIEMQNNGQLDVVFAGPNAGTNGTLLWEEPLVWTGEVTNSDMLDLVLMHAPCSFRKEALDALNRSNKAYKLCVDANSIQAVQASVKAGIGISVVPKSAVLEGMSFTEGLPALPSTGVMVYNKKDNVNLYAQRFVEFLVNEVNA